MRTILTFICVGVLILTNNLLAGKSTAGDSWKKCSGSNDKCPQITDNALQKCLEQKVRKPFAAITDTDYQKIKILGCVDKNIKQLEGIKNLVNLRDLDLEGNRISDIHNLASLTKLKKLYLWKNEITNISALSSLVNLERLHLSNNNISELQPISSLKNLTDLFADGNKIEDISPLSKLAQIHELQLADNLIQDITPLASLDTLAEINLANNPIADFTPVQTLAKLKYLDISNTNLTDLEAIKELEGLTHLILGNNLLTDITPLSKFKALTVLDLGANQIENIEALNKCVNLNILKIQNNLIKDISPLSKLKKIRVLNLNNNLVADLSALDSATALSNLYIAGNSIKNFDSIKHVANVSGREDQHDLWPVAQLAIQRNAREWIKQQTDKHCVEYDEINSFTSHFESFFYPDGIYETIVKKNRNHQDSKALTCFFAWNSKLDYFLLPLTRKKDSEADGYDLYTYSGFNTLYGLDGKIKGFSSKVAAPKEFNNRIENIQKSFNIDFHVKKITIQAKEALLVEKENYVIREIIEATHTTLQFFEKDFYEKFIAKQK